MNKLAWMACLLAAAAGSGLSSRGAPVEVRGSQIAGPAQDDPGQDWFTRMTQWRKDASGERGQWLKELRAWRADQLARIAYDGSGYDRPELEWTQRDFIQPQAMVEDRYLYDSATGTYTVGRYVEDVVHRYGGIDSVLLWPVYPNIGIDNRNQWDLARDLPGGVQGVRRMIGEFHRRGIRVFFPTMPWDTGTREPGVSHAEATARLLAEIGADGMNGDTMSGIPREYRNASDATGHPAALEPELAPGQDAMLAYNGQSWAYWEYPFVPMVSKLKWLEPRHMIHVCDRWATNHTDDLQYAFFNGVGFESWENIWGFWNQLTPRDAEVVRRIGLLYRSLPDLVVSRDWEPHVPTLRYGVFASRFPGQGRALWTLVNRNDFTVAEAVIAVEHAPGRRYYDLWRGTRITPRTLGGSAVLELELEPHGYGAVLAVDEGTVVDGLGPLMEAMKGRSSEPLRSFPGEWHFLPQRLVETTPTAAVSTAPAGMVAIPGGEFDFRVRGVEIEGEGKEGIDIQYPWEDSPRRDHLHRVALRPFFMDRFPVTNAQFKAFLDASRYHPADDHNFLLRWADGKPRIGEESSPVTWVSLEDARAYARWAGKRLPHEWEWQYAAQGADGRIYPWGGAWDDAAVPAPDRGHELTAPPAVGLHPRGASPFGVEDMVAGVWQWTDEYVDEHTRAAVLRGGSFYQPQGSYWYFPQAYRLTEHGKYLLMAPSKDRSGTVGFRCVVDQR